MDERLRELLEAHLDAAGTVAAWARDSGALRVMLLLAERREQPIVLDASPGEGLEVQLGDDAWVLDGDPFADLQPAVAFPEPAPPASIRIDPGSGEIDAPLGVLESLAQGCRALATAFGDAVATVEYPTADPRWPMTFSAREGDPVVIAVGDRHFQLGT